MSRIPADVGSNVLSGYEPVHVGKEKYLMQYRTFKDKDEVDIKLYEYREEETKSVLSASL